MKHLTEEQFKHTLRQLIYKNKKIDAIKFIRTYTGFGLKESKDLCDEFIDDLSKLDDYQFEIIYWKKKADDKVHSMVEDPFIENSPKEASSDPELNENELYEKLRSLSKKEKELNFYSRLLRLIRK